MASQIDRLPDLQGFLKLASVPDWQVVKLTPMSGSQPVRLRKPATVTSPSLLPQHLHFDARSDFASRRSSPEHLGLDIFICGK